MQIAGLGDLIAEKDEIAREQIARRVGEQLSLADLAETERKAAEEVARELVQDAVERVRRELSLSVKHSRFLPRDIAFNIAHDVDAISRPFLEVTEVFSESDWQQLILTISRGARVATAGRSAMSEGLALALAETGDPVVAEALVGNKAAPMPVPVCHALIEGYQNQVWILDKLAERESLHAAIVVQLIEKVSAAARDKLVETYDLPDHTGAAIAEAELAAVLDLIRTLPEPRLRPWALRLQREGRLTSFFLLTAVRRSALAFFETGLSVLSGARPERARAVVRYEGRESLNRLLNGAHISSALHDDFWAAVQEHRNRGNKRQHEGSA